jgi:hypothetical protein
MSQPGQIFVIGTARSGTTWLGNLLAAHPAITAVTAVQHHGVHESHLLDHTRYALPGIMSCEAFVAEYSREDYFKLAGLTIDDFCSVAPKSGDACDFFKAMMEEFARRVGARYWLEKTPKHAIYYAEILARFPNARFVVIERDFRAVLRSQLGKYARPGAPRWLQVLEKVFRYVSDMKAIAKLQRAARDKVMTISYEDLVQDTDRQIRRITDFLGLEPERLRSAYSPVPSFEGNSNEVPQSSALDLLAVELTRRLLLLVPFRLAWAVRNRRDRRQARHFPKYTRITQ